MAGVWASSGGLISSARLHARSVVRSTTVTRSSGWAKRTPWNWRSTSASTFIRENVARLPATSANATPAASISVASSKSPEPSNGRSFRPASVDTQPRVPAPPNLAAARARHTAICSPNR